MYVNGALSGARTGTSKFTAYVSPYMVVSQGGNYTKHVYMGSQRITSKVSNSGIFTASPVNTTDLQPKLVLQTTNIKERFDSLGVKYSGVQQTGGLVSASPATTADSYFYHSDHLGSSSLITNKDGYLVQHIQYVPFGEVFVEERNATWSTPYKFNGKEQDEETGLCYYGARYYDPRTSVWLSVDPLAEKKPWMTSYNYCSNNPINRIDPDGRDDVYNRQGNFVEHNNHEIDKRQDHIVIRDQNYLKKALISIGLGNTKFVSKMSDNIDTRVEKTTLSANAYSNIFTNILSKTNGVDMNNLYNGSVSVVVSHNDYNIDDQYNSPSLQSEQNGSCGTVDGQTRITASIINSGDEEDNRFLFSTTSNVQNLLGAHEKIGHGQKGWADATRTHHKVYEYQFKHDSWKNTTQPFKNYMKVVYQKYIYPTKK